MQNVFYNTFDIPKTIKLVHSNANKRWSSILVMMNQSAVTQNDKVLFYLISKIRLNFIAQKCNPEGFDKFINLKMS
jgi:hypothetical protein